MLLDYLFSNFVDEKAFARACGLSVDDLHAMIERRLAPRASYGFQVEGLCVSFVSECRDQGEYRFHLKGHTMWMSSVRRLGLDSEAQARRYFFARYAAAKDAFFAGTLGRQLASVAPDVPVRFDTERVHETWSHFLNGVYGVCTRDGQPETIFLKEAGVAFIDRIVDDGPSGLTADRLRLLEQTVSLLDTVESDFAAHEIASSSRQRCINDVRARFFQARAA